MSLIRDAIIELMRGKRDTNVALKMIGVDGGKGSGNFGHAGRPGLRGGSAKRGGGGGVSKERAKEIKQERAGFKKLTQSEKIKTLKRMGQFPQNGFQFDEDTAKMYADKHGMSVDKWLDWRAARYFTMKKFQPEIEYKTPLKAKEVQSDYIPSPSNKLKYVKEHTGTSDDIARKMRDSLSDHFGSGSADCEWTDKFIDSDGRYEGAIYRWKSYSGDKAKKIVAGLVPGAKVQNKHESNWSFSSDPWATSHFGAYNDHSSWGDGQVTIRYTCDRNITASPVQCLSGFGTSECEVIPHSKTTWTITSVEKVEMPKGGIMYDVHMVEDDWHEERGIPVWKPTGNEVSGGWREDFPKDDDGASNIYESIKTEANKSGSHEEINEFMKVCPVGTVFYKLSNDKLFVFRKCDSDYWEGADVTEEYNKSVQKWMDSFAEFELGEEWSMYDKDIWKRCEQAGLNKHITITQARNLLLDTDVALTQVGGKPKVPNTEEITEKLQEMKEGDFYGDKVGFFDGLPTGTTLYDKNNDFYLKKNDEGYWEYITSDGESVTSMESSGVWGYMVDPDMDFVAKKNGTETFDDYKKKFDDVKDDISNELYEFFNDAPVGTQFSTKEPFGEECLFEKQKDGTWVDKNGVKTSPVPNDSIWTFTGKTSELVSYPLSNESTESKKSGSEEKYETPAEQYEKFKTHELYGGVAEKLSDFYDNEDAKACEKWLKDAQEGLVLKGKTGRLICDGNGKWRFSPNGEQGPGTSMDVGTIAYVMTNPTNKQEYQVESIPVKVPDNVSDADKVLSGMKQYNPEQIEEYAQELPNGSMVMDVEGGFVYCKQKGEWEALDYETDEPNFDPEKEWYTYPGVIKGIDQTSIPKKFKGDGTFVLKLGEG